MIKRFQGEDLAEVNAWRELYGMPKAGKLPPVGFITPGIAAGFLYQTDSDIALLEGYVTNPKAPSAERNRALDEITESLIGEATRLGFKSVWGITRDAGISLRAQRHKMTRIGSFSVLIREIN